MNRADYTNQYRILEPFNCLYIKNNISRNVKDNIERIVNTSNGNGTGHETDINTKEKETVKGIENYQSY